MRTLLNCTQRSLFATTVLALLATQIASCGVSSRSGSPNSNSLGGEASGGGGGGAASTSSSATTAGYGAVSGGSASTTAAWRSATGGIHATGGTQGSVAAGGTQAHDSGVGGAVSVGGTSSAATNSDYVVSLVQSSKSNASELTQDDIKAMLSDAVTQAGGLDFIHEGMTVVLKPNLLTHLQQCWFGSATNPATVNGVTTDWRVTKAVADLVRARNQSGKILVMEGSARSTTAAYTAMGYTTANFGSSVDEFIALEGAACGSSDSTGLVQKPGQSGAQYWINQRYLDADVVISIANLKTHSQAGITGAVKNLGLGVTPAAKYSTSSNPSDCGRNQTANYIDHSFSPLGNFVSDYYSIRPADFAIMDGLQGLQNGPCSASANDRMNMRLILASKNAVALDTVEAAIMGCTGSTVPHLKRLEGWGLGTTDMAKISVVGNRSIADVKKSFKGAANGVTCK
jgi:uncharacterized protein (DUF362 family)